MSLVLSFQVVPMKFVLMFHEGGKAIAKRTHPEEGPGYWAGWSASMKEWSAQEISDAELPDECLALMFACAHPAIASAVRTALMWQCVLGLSAERIASAFLTSPSSMSQRLVRAKAKIRATGIALDVPHPRHLATRLLFVTDAIYAAFTTACRRLTSLQQTVSVCINRYGHHVHTSTRNSATKLRLESAGRRPSDSQKTPPYART